MGLGLVLALAGCAGPEREWMKTGQRYTVEEFRRDVKECTRERKLDEECMRQRGWVAVSPAKTEKAPEPLPGRAGYGQPRR